MRVVHESWVEVRSSEAASSSGEEEGEAASDMVWSWSWSWGWVEVEKEEVWLKMVGRSLVRGDVSALMMEVRGMVKRVVSGGISAVATG